MAVAPGHDARPGVTATAAAPSPSPRANCHLRGGPLPLPRGERGISGASPRLFTSPSRGEVGAQHRVRVERHFGAAPEGASFAPHGDARHRFMATAVAPSPSHRFRGGPLPLPRGEREMCGASPHSFTSPAPVRFCGRTAKVGGEVGAQHRVRVERHFGAAHEGASFAPAGDSAPAETANPKIPVAATQPCLDRTARVFHESGTSRGFTQNSHHHLKTGTRP